VTDTGSGIAPVTGTAPVTETGTGIAPATETETGIATVTETTTETGNTTTHSDKHESLYAQRIILTTYPGGVGVNPLALQWGAQDPNVRGPIVASRHHDSMKHRNAIGAHGGAYSVYRALAVAIRQLEPEHKPNLNLTEPVVSIGPFPSWYDPNQIVSMDPWGHIVQQVYAHQLAKGLDIRPTIAITKAHMQLAEIEAMVAANQLNIDGKVVLDARGQLMVVKGAVEPVWFLPGMSKRFGIPEATLRRALLCFYLTQRRHWRHVS
jgi:hypothetical protein